MNCLEEKQEHVSQVPRALDSILQVGMASVFEGASQGIWTKQGGD